MGKGKQLVFIVPTATKILLAAQSDERRKQAKYDAGQRWFELVTLAHSRLSRARLCDYAHDLAAQVMPSATLEDIRACCMWLEEEMSL